jgi:hypothetical protein
MEIQKDYKEEGKKLIRLYLELKENSINNISIRGDFFMHPEESIEELEKRLKGSDFNLEQIKGIVEPFFSNIESFGIDADSLLNAFRRCRDEI